MEREELEVTIAKLESLINDDRLHEEVFQEFFEQYPAIFEALGYTNWYSHPRLLDQADDDWIPDFLVERPSTVGEIVELKRPKVKLTYGTERRDGFMADVHKACN